jgi:hypothetical protein
MSALYNHCASLPRESEFEAHTTKDKSKKRDFALEKFSIIIKKNKIFFSTLNVAAENFSVS